MTQEKSQRAQEKKTATTVTGPGETSRHSNDDRHDDLNDDLNDDYGTQGNEFADTEKLEKDFHQTIRNGGEQSPSSESKRSDL